MCGHYNTAASAAANQRIEAQAKARRDLANKQEAVSGALARRAVDAINMKKGRDVSDAFAFAAGVIGAVQNGDNVEAIVNEFVQGYKL